MNKEMQRRQESKSARERAIALRVVILILGLAALAGWAALLASA
jgi:hypothetical protein